MRRVRSAVGHASELRRVAHTAGASLAAQGLFSVSGVIAANALGPSGRGTVVAILAWSGLIPSIALVGLDAGISLTVAQNPRAALRVALGNGLVYCIVVGAITASAMAITVPRIVAHLGPEGEEIAKWAMATIPIAMLANVLLGVNLALERYRLFNVCKILVPLVPLLVAAPCAIANVLTPGLMVGSTIAGTVVGVLALSWRLPWRTLAVDMRALLSELRFSAKIALSAWLGVANLRLDFLLMSAFVPAAQLGYYSVANNVMIMVTTIPFAAATLLTPAIARLNQTDNDNADRTRQQLSLIRHNASRYSLLAIAGGALLAAMAPFGVPLLFGSAFSPAIVLIWILIPGFCARVYAELVTSGTTGLRRPWVANVTEGAGLVVTAALLPFLLPPFQARGAAVVSTAAYLVSAGTAVLSLRWIRLSEPSVIKAKAPPHSRTPSSVAEAAPDGEATGRLSNPEAE